MMVVSRLQLISFMAIALAWLPHAGASGPTPLTLQPHDHVILVGNTLAERMQYFGNFETLLHARFPRHELYVRDLAKNPRIRASWMLDLLKT